MNRLALWAVCLMLLIAVITDIKSRRIPNWMVLPGMLAGIIASVFFSGWHGLAQSLEGFLLSAAVFGVLACLKGMGMGDVKLCAAIGAWIGPSQMFIALILISLFGGVVAILWAIKDRFLVEMFKNIWRLLRGVTDRGLRPHPELVLSNPATHKMPYAPVIAVGTLLSFLATK